MKVTANHPVNPDAREASRHVVAPSARAGYRGR